MRWLIYAVLILFINGKAAAQILFSDSFDGDVVDSGKWDLVYLNQDSAVSLQGGAVKSTNGGVIISRQEFFGSYIVTGTFRKSSLFDAPRFVLLANPEIQRGEELGGLNFYFSEYAGGYFLRDFNDPGPTNANEYPWEIFTPTGDTEFKITASGNSFILDVGGFEMLNIQLSDELLQTGRLAFFTGGSGYSELLEIKVSVPEPSSLSLLLAGGAVLMAGRRRKV